MAHLPVIDRIPVRELITQFDEAGQVKLSRPTVKFFQNLATQVLVFGKVPSSASASGSPGMIAYDGSFLYVCVAMNSWKRTGLSSW